MAEKLYAKDFFEENHIPLCVFRMPYVDWSRDIHSHEFHKVMIVLGGVAILQLPEKHQTISMGDVFVIPPDFEHGFEVMENTGVQVLNVLFDLEKLKMNILDLNQVPGFHALFSLKPPARFVPHLKLEAKDLAYLNSICERIEEEQESMALGCDFACQTRFRDLILFLTRRYSYVATQPDKNLLTVGGVVSYMETHMDEEVRFEKLLEIAHMSPTSLRRAFQETFSCSPMAYLQKLRVKKAMLLLSNPRKSISEIAFEIGFNDSGYFSRVFKEETGATPMLFRSKITGVPFEKCGDHRVSAG